MLLLFLILAFNNAFLPHPSVKVNTITAMHDTVVLGPVLWVEESGSAVTSYQITDKVHWRSSAPIITLGNDTSVTIGIYADTVKIYAEGRLYADIFRVDFYEEDLNYPPLFICESVVYSNPELWVDEVESYVTIEKQPSGECHLTFTHDEVAIHLNIGWKNDTIPIWKDLRYTCSLPRDEVVISWGENQQVSTVRYQDGEQMLCYDIKKGKPRKRKR